MAQKVGGLFVSMAASSARFAKDMVKARVAAQKSSGGISKGFKGAQRSGAQLTQSMGKLKGGIIAAAGPAAMLLLIKRSIDVADKTAKVADKIGLSTDALQEYRFAASLAGVEQSALDMGLQRFVRRAGEAAQGVGELRQTLDQYGIDVRDANGQTRDSVDVLDDLADVIMNAESEQEQLRIAFKAFDSEGAALVNMLKKGSAGLDEYKTKAHSLGIVIEEDLLRNAEAAKDQFTIMSRVISSQLTTAVLTLAPQITSLTESITAGLPALFAYVQKFLEWSGIISKSPVDEVTGQIDILNGQISDFTADIGRLQNATFFKATRIEAVVMKMEDLLIKRAELQKQLEGLEAEEKKAHEAQMAQIQEQVDAELKKNETAAEFAKSQAKKKQDLKTFNELFKALTTEEFQLQRDELAKNLEEWAAAGASKTELDRVEAEKRKEIARQEFQSKAENVKKFADLAMDIGNLWLANEKKNIDKDAAIQETAADRDYARLKAQITRENTVEGELTEAGLAKMGQLEQTHAARLQNIKSTAARKEKAAAKALKPIKMAQAASNTAVEASKVLSNPVALAFVLAAGAVQLATIAAQPYGKGGVVSSPTFFSTPSGPGVAGEVPGESEAILPLARGPGGDLGVNASGLGGDTFILEQHIHFDGITPEQDTQDRVIPQIEDAARRGVTKIISTDRLKTTGSGLLGLK